MSSYIKSISYYLPEKILTNEQLAEVYKDWLPEKISEKTGIVSRHIAAENETALDLGVKASKRLLSEHDINPKDIDFVLLATQSPDYLLPTSACILQNELGIPTSAGALDFNLGCSAYIYGLALAKAIIASGMAKNTLLVTAETYSKHINPMDKSTRTIFGDGAAASLITEGNVGNIGMFVLGSDGSGSKHLIIPAGAMRTPKSDMTKKELQDDSGNIRSSENLFMDGPEIFNFTIEVVPNCVQETLEKNRLTFTDIDMFIFHQANKYMLDFLRRRLRIPEEKFYVNFSDIGNTVSATIPIALSRAAKEERIKKGDKIMLVGFGVGLSWGATIIEW